MANPVDVIKIRMMVNTGRYSSLVNGFTSIIKNEGARALYNGLVPSTLRGLPFMSLHLLFFVFVTTWILFTNYI
ncbi:solute carrier family 25 protein [archaeon]|nr:MAG: solute carrier family 25 protein [archaeon]